MARLCHLYQRHPQRRQFQQLHRRRRQNNPLAAAISAAMPFLSNPSTSKENFNMPTKPGTYAKFKTSEGTVVCELFEKDAPETVANFIGLAEGTKDWNSRSKKGAKLYDGTIFHRVIPQFMIQGGDPEGTGMGGSGYKFADETKGSKHGFQEKGKLAMANAGPNTNGSQFFITVADTSWLTGKHTIFGEVIEGYDIVEKISKVSKDGMDRPKTPVVLESVTIERVA
jgi:peptidyl-prolyl cis-trans isomerase A (cyclophilin A)